MWITLKRLIDYFLDILFPRRCIGCDSIGYIICNDCVNKIDYAKRETADDIIAAYDYRDPLIKKVIWDLKYHHQKYLGKKLGELLYNTLIEEISEIRTFSSGLPILIIPVPVSKSRKILRGYNQSLSIAKGFCDSGQKNLFELRKDIVLKKIETVPQAKITNRNERLNNVKGVFKIKKSETVKNRTIIIIDDVTTTGGTIREMINVLKKAGANRVIGFAIAH